MPPLIATFAQNGFRSTIRTLFSSPHEQTKEHSGSRPKLAWIRRKLRQRYRNRDHVYQLISTQDDGDYEGAQRSTYKRLPDGSEAQGAGLNERITLKRAVRFRHAENFKPRDKPTLKKRNTWGARSPHTFMATNDELRECPRHRPSHESRLSSESTRSTSQLLPHQGPNSEQSPESSKLHAPTPIHRDHKHENDLNYTPKPAAQTLVSARRPPLGDTRSFTVNSRLIQSSTISKPLEPSASEQTPQPNLFKQPNMSDEQSHAFVFGTKNVPLARVTAAPTSNSLTPRSANSNSFK